MQYVLKQDQHLKEFWNFRLNLKIMAMLMGATICLVSVDKKNQNNPIRNGKQYSFKDIWNYWNSWLNFETVALLHGATL